MRISKEGRQKKHGKAVKICDCVEGKEHGNKSEKEKEKWVSRYDCLYFVK
jgi:hypothetical protein